MFKLLLRLAHTRGPIPATNKFLQQVEGTSSPTVNCPFLLQNLVTGTYEGRSPPKLCFKLCYAESPIFLIGNQIDLSKDIGPVIDIPQKKLSLIHKKWKKDIKQKLRQLNRNYKTINNWSISVPLLQFLFWWECGSNGEPSESWVRTSCTL